MTTDTTYTYEFFDAHSGPYGWDIEGEIEADSDEDAVAQVREILRPEVDGLSREPDYDEGDLVWALIWDEDGMIVAQIKEPVT